MTWALIGIGGILLFAALVFVCDMAIIVKAKRDKAIQRRDFYQSYTPPAGKAAVLDRKMIAEDIRENDDEPMNRRQRKALAAKVQREMARRAQVAKREAS